MEAAAALADQTRMRIVERLARHDLSAGELAAGFDTSRPAVSRHLRVLREAGLVSVEQRGQQRIYRLVPQPLEDLETWIAGVRRFWSQRLDALATEVERGKRARRHHTEETHE
jgi:DNA-binding transcriptional ArsR family regulator